jgi:hypothetical protein
LSALGWERVLARERDRYADGLARLAPPQLVRMAMAAYGEGLALLMLGRLEESRDAFGRSADRFRESWEHADGEVWGRPIGALKAVLIAGLAGREVELAGWTVGLGAGETASPIGRYAGSLGLLTLGRWEDARHVAESLLHRDDFPEGVADSLVAIAAGDEARCALAVEGVLTSFETRGSYLEDVPVGDTVLALRALAVKRGLALSLRVSPVLPPDYDGTSDAAARSR